MTQNVAKACVPSFAQFRFGLPPRPSKISGEECTILLESRNCCSGVSSSHERGRWKRPTGRSEPRVKPRSRSTVPRKAPT